VYSDLNFTMAMYNAEQREIEAEDLEMLKRAMNEMKDEIAEIRLAITEVTTLMSSANQLDLQIKGGEIPVDKTGPLIEEYKAPRVDPSELSEPFVSNDNVRGSERTVHKKIFRGIEVACKKVKFTDSGQDGDEKVTDRFETKISNFELSRSMQGVSSKINNIRWLAPEKMRKSSQQRYNHQYEPSARPSNIEMRQKLKDLFNEHVFSKGISPQIHPKRTDSGDIPGLELTSFQEKVIISDSKQSIEQFEPLYECDGCESLYERD
ncbi:12815_t:CDS:2, partial [Racocetra persica]